MMEVLVVLVISAILMASIDAVFVQQTRAMAFQEDLVDLEENLRAAMGILHRDIRTAGLGLVAADQAFMTGNIDMDLDGTPDGNATNHFYSNNPVLSDHANRVFKPDALRLKFSHPAEGGIRISTYNAPSANMQVCGPSGLSDGDIIRVLTPPPTVQFRAVEITNFNTNCTDATCPNNDCDKMNFSPGPSELNTAGGLGGAYENGLVMLSTRVYYLGEDADGYPALFRMHNYQTPHAIIAFGIVDLQVEYGFIDINGDIDYRPLGGNGDLPSSAESNFDQNKTIKDVTMVKLTLTGETRNSHKLSSGPAGKSQRSLATEIQVRNLFY